MSRISRPTPSVSPLRVTLTGLLVLGSALLFAAAPAPGDTPHGTEARRDFDIRTDPRIDSRTRAARLLEVRGMDRRLLAASVRSQAGRLLRTAEELRARLPGLEVAAWPLTGNAELVAVPGRALTDPAPDMAALALALGFLRRHPGLYGLSPEQIDELRFLGESVSPSGLRMVVLEQTAGGLPVFQGRLRVLLDRDGRVVRTVGRVVPGLDADLETALLGDRVTGLSAAQALATALAGLGHRLDPQAVKVTPRTAEDSPGRFELAAGEVLSAPASAQRVLFPLGPGVVVPAWTQVVHLGDGAYLLVVDSRDGELLWRSSLRRYASIHDASTQEARFSVYVQEDGVTPAESPAPGNPNRLTPGSRTQYPRIARSTVSMSEVQDLEASPGGWIPDGGVSTTGNNADAYLDTDADDRPDAALLDHGGRPMGNPDASGRNRDFLGSSPRDFQYQPPPAPGQPTRGDKPEDSGVRRGALVQAFYIANWFHDRLYRMGFDEAAGNFQSDNYGRGGVGGDPFLIETQDGEGLGDARIDVAPDGAPGRVHVRLYPAPGTYRDGALDAYLVLHELVHGLTLRVMANGIGLYYSPLGALSEGWADFYALALLHGASGTHHDPDGQYAAGGWMVYHESLAQNYLYGVRRFPYTTDNSVNPLTWADTDSTTLDLSGGIPPHPWDQSRRGAAEVHNAGELWALSLWEVRSRIIAAHGGDVTAGNETTLQIVTDALKATPSAPTFLQARDALLDVDCVTHRCAHERQIWGGFADRGLGWGAYVSPTSITAHYGVSESFALPHLDVARVAVDDSAAGNGNGFLDPGETAELVVELFNPWRERRRGVPGATARLTSSTPGVEILDDTAAWGPLAARATVQADDTFQVRLGPHAACGGRVELTFEIDSAQGTVTVPYELRLGRPAGLGATRVFQRRIPGGLGIPDDLPAGVVDTLWIDDDLEIADLDFRIDELRHSFVGNLAIALKGPNGYGFDPVYLPADRCGANGDYDYGCNDGNDFVGTVFDDEAGTERDLLVVGRRAAPFTGRWIPFGNSPALVVRGRSLTDPVGQLGHFDGTSTRGAWNVLAADSVRDDQGTLYGWSLIVTPRRYTCAAVPRRRGTLHFETDVVAATEGSPGVPVTVHRTGGADGPVTVSYASRDLTATAGEDYQPVSGTLTWGDGDAAPKTFTVPLSEDTVPESGELIELTLGDPTGGAALGTDTAWVVLRDGDRPPGCAGEPMSLCLLGGRFEVEVSWRDPRTGDVGHGGPIPDSDKTGMFWFFDPANVELIVKMLDGRALTDAFWLFYGALSDVEYWVVATDTDTGRLQLYRNPPFEICGRADTLAFPETGAQWIFRDPHAPSLPATEHTPAAGATATPGLCAEDAETLCLLDGRFQVRVGWHDPRSGDRGSGRAVLRAAAAGGPTGFFWFFEPGNLELVVKVLDATSFSGKFWVFYGALTDVEYTISVTDTVRGVEREYHSPPYEICGDADTAAFDGG